MIGALSTVEEHFGFLWGFEIPEEQLTPEQKHIKAIFEDVRAKILDRGNTQIRSLESEFVNYEISKKKYFINLPMAKSKGEEDEEFHLEFISAGMMSTPDLSISEAKKEMLKFGNIAQKMNGYVSSLLVEKDNKKIAKLLKKVKKYEEITDRIELEIADYLARSRSSGEAPEET